MAIISTSDLNFDDMDTIPKILLRNFVQYGDRVAMRKKNLGIWQEYTWKDVYEHVEWICLGLYSLGAKKGDRIIIIGNNDPELVWAQWGAQHAQLIVSCLYVDYLPDEVKYFIRDCEAKFIVCEDQEQVDKVIRIRDECPSLERVIYWDPKGLWSYEEPYLMRLEKLEMIGREYGKEHQDLFKESVNQIKAEDIAVIIYTSGTTGQPKGNIQTYESLLEWANDGSKPIGFQPWDEYLSYASPAWGEQLVGMTICPQYPLIMSFAEEPETIMADLRDIGPHFIWFAGRQWEDLARRIRIGIEEASAWKRIFFNCAMRLSFKRSTYIENGKPVPFYLRMLFRVADFCILRKVRDYLGMKKSRACASGGILTSPDLPRFFVALGLPFINMYGTVEVGMLTSSPLWDTNYSSIGKVNPGKKIKIEDSQIFAKVGSERLGYWNDPGLWEEKVKNGWYPTGDAGWMDQEGYIYYIDRISDMVALKNGYKFSPQFVETRLRFNPYIKEAVVFGAGEEYVVAIISCDFKMVGNWAERKHIPYTTLVEMSQLPPILNFLGKQIREVNRSLPEESQVWKFISLHKEFDADEAELTRSRKLKRTVISKKYIELIGGMYQNRAYISIETEVVYKDGRKAKTRTSLKVNSVF